MPTSPRIQPLIHVSVAITDANLLLLVREQKPSLAGLWNLPGGHVERGETILNAAERELREETTIIAAPNHLVGIYSSPTSVRFVFGVPHNGQTPAAGDEIMEVKFIDLAELHAWPDSYLAGPAMLRLILADLKAQKKFPLTPFVTAP